MSARFTVFASGSSGNASLLEVDGFGLLIDCGLGPRALASRFSAVGQTWKAVSAVLLTHIHGDHWNTLTFAHLARLKIPLYAHPLHHDNLRPNDGHAALRKAGLVRDYEAGQRLSLRSSLETCPVPVPHDAEPTFAFRVEYRSGSEGWAFGLASDVGHGTTELQEAFLSLDGLALEFNHDVRMQKQSRRGRDLIARVLGDRGHLSNVQAADLTRSLIPSARAEPLQFVVQLHLSRECNTPQLAMQPGQAALQDSPQTRLITACQFNPTDPLPLVARAWSRPVPVRTQSRPDRPRAVQLTLPGLDEAG